MARRAQPTSTSAGSSPRASARRRGRAPSKRVWLSASGAALLALLAVVLIARSASGTAKTFNPGPPIPKEGAGLASAQQQRAPRPAPPPEKQIAMAEGDVAEAAQIYVRALFAKDDLTASQYRSGFGELMRKNEDDYELDGLSARPMTWGEAGYTDADPDLEWAEVVARVHGRKQPSSGAFYYKLGFKRNGDALALDMSATRLDVREGDRGQ